MAPHTAVGRDATCYDEILPGRVTPAKPSNRIRRPIDQRLADGEFDGGGEIGSITLVKGAAFIHDLTHGRLETGERKVAPAVPLQRARQPETRGVSSARGALDRRAAGVTQSD